MDGVALLGFDRTFIVHRLTEDIEQTAEGLRAHRDADPLFEIFGGHASDQSVGRLESDGAYAAFAQVLLDLANDVDGVWCVEPLTSNANGVIDSRQVASAVLHVDGRPGDLDDFSDFRHFVSLSSMWCGAG